MTTPVAFDPAAANVGDRVTLADGREVTILGVRISSVEGNSILIAEGWIDAAQVAAAA